PGFSSRKKSALLLLLASAAAITSAPAQADEIPSGAYDTLIHNASEDITQSGAITVSGGSFITGTGSITLTNADNDFSDAVSLTGGVVQITDMNALMLGDHNTGSLTAVSHGHLNLGSG